MADKLSAEEKKRLKEKFRRRNVSGGRQMGDTDFFNPEGKTNKKSRIRNPLGKSMKDPSKRVSSLGKSSKE